MLLLPATFIGISADYGVASQGNQPSLEQLLTTSEGNAGICTKAQHKAFREAALQGNQLSLGQPLATNKANTGTCTEARHRTLQDKVDALKLATSGKSCSEKKNPAITKADATANAEKFEALAAARDAINKECYGGGDEGHKIAANEARAAAKTCRAVN
jgi:Novel toxin 16